ncbi:DUF4183 domain-containing protein [Niallia sp. 03133]|uniref:DUF4183 domain-containing protein n=1 Tax=Niallia sp. 03133 TaxID=3458060 RepID=UPI004044FE2F
MQKKRSKIISCSNSLAPPLIYYHVTPTQQKIYRTGKIRIFEFYSISNGEKRIYTENDALQEYGKQVILDPLSISYMNLFVNGVLQPHKNYEVKKGKIIIKTEDIPQKGSPIILQMIVI